MRVSDIMIKKEIELLDAKIKLHDDSIERINKINTILKDKVTLLNYSDKIKSIRDILLSNQP